MAKYRKKPVVIEAFKLGTDPYPVWSQNTDDFVVTVDEERASIKTLEGVMFAVRGDYIIQGVKGELYPCKPDIFAATYEPAE